MFNHATTAIEVLYDAAESGSTAARESLHALTERLAAAAGRYGSPMADDKEKFK